uniref:PinX1-related protein 1 n=1 Tax=Globisporangium ultimum (strain ATCC 200006 / CBS 805.95 / DAOM BR144) TaxID=431595 RepID=K3WMW5_GLOUD
MAPEVDTTSGAAADTQVDEGQLMVQMGGMQNMAWAADTSKFGYKMLVKMGWAAGKGVGKDLQGQATHVKIARRSENLGVGCSLKQAEVQGWSSTATSFADVLKTLNKKYGDKSDSGSESDASSSLVKKKKDKKSKKDKKAKKAKKQAKRDKKVKEEAKKTTISRRIVYHKRLRNKNAKGYAAEDMAGILGLAASTAQAE